MIGTPAIGAFVALWGFWVLLVVGWVRGDLGVRGTAVFIALWLAGHLAAGLVLYGLLFAPYVAILDIVLVFAIFKGDVRLF
jgi:hypothetical protein